VLECSAPFLISISLLYQFRPTHTDRFPNSIVSSDAASYGENRENGGLTTEIAESEEKRRSGWQEHRATK